MKFLANPHHPQIRERQLPHNSIVALGVFNVVLEAPVGSGVLLSRVYA